MLKVNIRRYKNVAKKGKVLGGKKRKKRGNCDEKSKLASPCEKEEAMNSHNVWVCFHKESSFRKHKTTFEGLFAGN